MQNPVQKYASPFTKLRDFLDLAKELRFRFLILKVASRRKNNPQPNLSRPSADNNITEEDPLDLTEK